MIPSLDDGDRVLVVPHRLLLVGDLVVFRDRTANDRELVKRIARIEESGLFVLGDNEGASRDSREIGLVSPAAVVGLVWYRYFPIAHAGTMLTRPAQAGHISRQGGAC